MIFVSGAMMYKSLSRNGWATAVKVHLKSILMFGWILILQTIRETYGSVQHQCPAGPSRIRILFIVGQVANTSLQSSLLAEAAKEKDMIQSGAFIDGYGQSTRKGISLIHWSLLNCPQARFTAKADDDCNNGHFVYSLFLEVK